MSSAHDVQAYEYVSRPYDDVSERFQRDALGVFQRATTDAMVRAQTLVSTLRAGIGPVELGVDVIVSVASIAHEANTPFGPRTRLCLAWEASQHPELFPTMDATLDIYALGPGETQLDFHGSYRPPLGVVGAALDAAIGHRIAQAAVHRFVEDLAGQLRADDARATSPCLRTHLSRTQP
jgi:hypothetical protein